MDRNYVMHYIVSEQGIPPPDIKKLYFQVVIKWHGSCYSMYSVLYLYRAVFSLKSFNECNPRGVK
jgi:hypothetical protein